MWEKTARIPGFNRAVNAYWRATKVLARNLIKLIAVALDMPADRLDHLITYSCGDMTLNFYPGTGTPHKTKPETSGLYQDGLAAIRICNVSLFYSKTTSVECKC